MQLVFPLMAAPRGDAHPHLEGTESHGVAEVKAIAHHGRHLVPRLAVGETGKGGISPFKGHFLQHVVGGDVVIDVAKLPDGQRLAEQSYRVEGLTVGFVGTLAIERDGIRIANHPPLKGDWQHAVAFKLQGQQAVGGNFERGKQADVGVGEHLHLPCLDIHLPEVADAGIVGTAYQVAVVEREAELPQVGIAPRHQLYGLEDGLLQLLQVEEHERLLAVVARACQREEGAVVAHVDVEDADAKGERINHLGLFQVFVVTHDGVYAAIGEEAVETVVRVVVDDVAYALIVLPLNGLPPVQVVHLQAAHLLVVDGEDEAPAAQVEGYAGRVVELHAVNVGQPALLASGEVNLSEAGKTPRGIDGGVSLARDGIVNQWRDGAHRSRGYRVTGGRTAWHSDRRGGGDGILTDGVEVGLLVPALVLLPVVPCLAQRASEHLLELAAEERVAVGRAVVEADELVVAILPCEVADEARAVEIGVGTHLEVHGGALGLQSHHREQLVAAIDDAAEVHLVVAAQGASYASAHPGLHETGYALVIPARRIPAGHAQVAPQGRQGMLVVGRHLGSVV